MREGENALIRGTKTHIFVDEPYGCEAIEFYKLVFGAIELKRVYEYIETGDEIKGDIRVVSSELQFGSTSVIVSELVPNSSWLKKINSGIRTPRGIMSVYMEDINAVVALALELGAVEESRDFDYDGVCTNADLRDPYGILWCIRPACMISNIGVEGSSSNDAPTPPQDIPKETGIDPRDIDEETEEEEEEEEEVVEIRKKGRLF
ncbi:hypothetical protein POM88_047542 [Heracleum sosnowskyi]|uniref:Glyoxalase At5g48480-like N-terminal domain-containing protein n=1 Tax=Heracleum sosnowskyi TaxID=360622 RepID=A0AAD8LYU9_9APIA|nr:hypothetical protein POM88_047542 [Heracleum sosnowskyi]